MIHTIYRRYPVPPVASPALSPVDRAYDDLMHALYRVRREFNAAERKQIGADMRALRRAARGERVG